MKSRSSEIRRARPLLGTIVEIGARGPHASIGIEAAFREIDTVHRLMSFHESSSDVSRINRASSGTIVHIDRRTHEVLACAQLMSHLSAGAFDVTVGGNLVKEALLPKPQGSESFDTQVFFRDIVLLPDDSVLLKRSAWIDLGGIAKGYAVDRAVIALRKAGVVSGIVNAGGDLFVFGDPQRVHIRHPENSTVLLPLGSILNSAVASSSGCFNKGDDGRAAANPLFEPRRKRRVSWGRGITIIASHCIIADALTKVVRLAPRRAPRVLSQFGAQALIIDRRGIRVFAANGTEKVASVLKSVVASKRASNPHQAVTVYE